MFQSTEFDRVLYRKPVYRQGKPISKLLGFDSEAFTDGSAFMFCTSLGDVLRPADLPGVFFTERYDHANFVTFNLKYDSGAILQYLPEAVLRELWREGRAVHETDLGFVKYKYVPHKMLRISKGNDSVRFWDVSQFFKGLSLDAAAARYLNERKLAMTTKRFRPPFVARNWRAIAKYCIRDAELAQRLAVHLVDKLDKFDIHPSTIYSCASISFDFFSSRTRIVNVWRYWQTDKPALAHAVDSYAGGKFEVTSRGYFPHVYEYDIVSAYPYQIRNLVDIKHAHVLHTTDYQADSVYGFLRCRIDNSAGRPIPCGPMVGGIRIYPAGVFYLTITKDEYDYMVEMGLPCEILSGAWFFVNKIRHPYAGPIDEVFRIKDEYKKKDPSLSYISKIIMNSFYGKCVQAIENRGQIYVGSGWNPVYGSIITARTRLMVCRMQELLGSDCLGVHTDSVLTTRPLPPEIACGGLGNFEAKAEGPAWIIACGMYHMGERSAVKGFKPKRLDSGQRDTWPEILGRWPHRSVIPYSMTHVQSWVETMAKNHDMGDINLFDPVRKKIDLNPDQKRVWSGKWKGRDFLTRSENSLPFIRAEISPPDFWAGSCAGKVF